MTALAFFCRSDNKGQGQSGQLTREGRRRSSWHDLGSFFRQKEGAPLEGGETKVEGAENADGVVCLIDLYAYMNPIEDNKCKSCNSIASVVLVHTSIQID